MSVHSWPNFAHYPIGALNDRFFENPQAACRPNLGLRAIHPLPAVLTPYLIRLLVQFRAYLGFQNSHMGGHIYVLQCLTTT